ncbi:unnamed protein product, partial [Effrenium voratum]
DLGDLQYIAEVSIGSSSSTFRLILDTGSSDLWVSGEQFIPSLSDTWTPLPQAGLVKLDYGQGEVEGIVGVDKACLLAKPVPLCVEQEFLVAKQVSDLSLNTFDGILGLGLPGLSHANQDFVQSLARSYREVQCFSFSLNREDSKSFALFGPCAKLLRKAAKETHLPEEQAALLSVQRLFGFARGWWLVSLAISCDGTRIWQGPDMYSICGLEVAALLLLSLYPGRRSSRGQSSDCRKRVCNACFALCSFFQALVLMLLLIALLVLLAPMVVNAFQSKVLVALDTGTSLIVIPTENFQQVADAMFGLRLRDSCVLSNSELLCACEVAAEAGPTQAVDGRIGFEGFRQEAVFYSSDLGVCVCVFCCWLVLVLTSALRSYPRNSAPPPHAMLRTCTFMHGGFPGGYCMDPGETFCGARIVVLPWSIDVKGREWTGCRFGSRAMNLRVGLG